MSQSFPASRRESQFEAALAGSLGAAIFAFATAAGAQVRIAVPGTPVPVTLQVFSAVLSGVVLGSRLGAASQALCLLCGAAGLPFFAGGGFGIAHLAGPTGGYILAFPMASAAAGLACGRPFRVRLAACALSLALIYLAGAGWLALELRLCPARALALGILPFFTVDLLKVAAAAAVGGLSSGCR